MTIRPKVQFLAPETIARVIDEAYDLLWAPGVRVHYREGLALLADGGANVDFDSQVAHIQRPLAEQALATAPSSFFLYNLRGEPAVHYGGDDVHFDPGSAAIEFLDYGATTSRPPVTADCIQYAKVAQMLPHIDAVSTALVCSDVPQSLADWYRLYLLLLYTGKPIVTGAFSLGGFPLMQRLLALVAGGDQALADKPRAVFDVCPSPPLIWSEITCANLVDAARSGIPAELVSMPLTGATGPATIIGSVVQHAAESLSGITIHQLARPGSPIVWGGSPAAFDMRTGTTPMGSIATMMLDCAYAEVGKAIKPGGLPTHAYMGMSDSKIIDAQTGLESASGALLGALAGINMISGPGMLDFESCFSLEKLVIDDEIAGMLARMARGLDDSEHPLARDLIREVGHEGSFLKHKHTRRHFKQEDYMPTAVIDRDVRQAWHDKGALDMNARAHARVEELLAAYRPVRLDENITRELTAMAEKFAHEAGLDQLPPRPHGGRDAG